MRATVRNRVLTAPCLALLTLAGCGGAGPKPAPTKAQFTARADAICRAEAENLRRAAAFEHAPVAAFSTVPRLIREAVVLREAATGKLESLRKPAGDAKAIEQWITARTVQATLQRDAAEAPVGEYLKATRDVQAALARANALARRLSERYGFTICGK
jgi:hypothetical protein